MGDQTSAKGNCSTSAIQTRTKKDVCAQRTEKKPDEQCDLVIQRTFKNVTAEIKVQSEKSSETSDFNWENWIKAMKISSAKVVHRYLPTAQKNSICV